MKRIATLVCACVALLAGASGRAADAPSGYVGTGNLVVRTQVGGMGAITVGGNIAMEELGGDMRIDILSLALPGIDSTISSVLGTQLFPPGGFTIVFDRTSGSYVIWSNAKRAYYQSVPSTAPNGPPPPPVTSTPGPAGGDFFSAFAVTKYLREDSALNLSLSLAGHGTVNGHPATGVNFLYQRTTMAGDTTDLHGTVQFADDLDGVPVEISLAGKMKGLPDSSFRLDFTSLQKQTPSAADFVPPPGFTHATSLGDVIGKNLQLPGN